ncbi:MAG TPA: MBL fold metallo-hydrolase [Micrococcaceae bacterium]|jgi:glyoxylase-like metal-dependent hydrolase (beta-lactamase superfamily II)|nr:MBL fold metallo-hydrolase [Micrococcaceae bacterium]
MTAQLWDLPEVTIRGVSVGEMDNNVYLITARKTGTQVLIDAADDVPAIEGLLASGAGDIAAPGTESATARLELIITTHSHWDHVRALPALAARRGVRTAAGRADVPDIKVRTDVALDHGHVLSLDGFDLETIALRGHTPGSVALLYRDPNGPAHLFTGDSLFPGGVGNTQKDPGRFTSLMDDVTARVFDVLPDDTVVHPGHGAGTTVGAERPQLAEWRSRGW